MDRETELEVEILGPVEKQNYNEETGTYEYKLLQPPSGNEPTLKIESRQKFEEENGIAQNDLMEDEDASLDDFDDEGMKYYVLRHRILTRARELDVYKQCENPIDLKFNMVDIRERGSDEDVFRSDDED